MRWILALMVCLLPLTDLRADGPDDQFVEIYALIQQADNLDQTSQPAAAVEKYQKAQLGLKTLQGGFPNWNKDVVQFRLNYVTEKLEALKKGIPAPAPVIKLSVSTEELERQAGSLEEQVRALTRENSNLERKLKEALAVQPAAIDPQELAKAEARITALQKEKDLLTVSLEQEKTARLQAEAGRKAFSEKELDTLRARAKKADSLATELDAQRLKLKELNQELATLKARPTPPPKLSDAELSSLRAKAKHADESAEELSLLLSKWDKVNKENAALKARLAEPPKNDNAELSSLRAKAKEAYVIAEERDALRDKLDSAKKEISVLKSHPSQPPKSNDAELARLQADNETAQKKLDETKRDLATLKETRRQEIRQAEDAKSRQFDSEREQLKKRLADTVKAVADAEARGDEQLLTARKDADRFKDAASQRDALAVKLKATEEDLTDLRTVCAAAMKNQPGAAGTALNRQITQLQARLAVFEANPVPYTAEEQAVVKKATVNATPNPPVGPGASHAVRSMKDLPPGAGALMADAQRAFLAHDYEKAEKKYREILSEDPAGKNVYVLAHLANAQFAGGKIEDCEKTVNEVIALDPNDPAGLYLLGNLRLRQGKLDDAVDALSRSAQINPTNSVTQNSLGSALSQKGQRKAAETALRKALITDPDYADAHHNLAIVYATETPPSFELARLHYKKALDLGHPRDNDLEKLLDEKR